MPGGEDCLQSVFVVLHLFAGVPRSGDVEEHFRSEAAAHALDFIFCSVDLLTSADSDLSQPWHFDLLSALIEEGLIDVVLGGPPCSTWSALRWLPGGPRPLRLRWTMPWGRDSFTMHERPHCALANILALNSLALMDGCSLRGGAHLLEHLADPLVVQPWNSNPIASLFDTGEYKGMARRAGSEQYLFDQGMLGGPSRKRTCMSTDLDGFGEELWRRVPHPWCLFRKRCAGPLRLGEISHISFEVVFFHCPGGSHDFAWFLGDGPGADRLKAWRAQDQEDYTVVEVCQW